MDGGCDIGPPGGVIFADREPVCGRFDRGDESDFVEIGGAQTAGKPSHLVEGGVGLAAGMVECVGDRRPGRVVRGRVEMQGQPDEARPEPVMQIVPKACPLLLPGDGQAAPARRQIGEQRRGSHCARHVTGDVGDEGAVDGPQ